jgi:hypothetical protein
MTAGKEPYHQFAAQGTLVPRTLKIALITRYYRVSSEIKKLMRGKIVMGACTSLLHQNVCQSNQNRDVKKLPPVHNETSLHGQNQLEMHGGTVDLLWRQSIASSLLSQQSHVNTCMEQAS